MRKTRTVSTGTAVLPTAANDTASTEVVRTAIGTVATTLPLTLTAAVMASVSSSNRRRYHRLL